MGEPSSVIYGIICSPPALELPSGQHGQPPFTKFERERGYTSVLSYNHTGCSTQIFRLPVPPIKPDRSAKPLAFHGNPTNAKKPIAARMKGHGIDNVENYDYKETRHKLSSVVGDLRVEEKDLLVSLEIRHHGHRGRQWGEGSLAWNAVHPSAIELGHGGEDEEGRDTFEVVDMEYVSQPFLTSRSFKAFERFSTPILSHSPNPSRSSFLSN